MLIRPLAAQDTAWLQRLAEEAQDEGFQFVTRFLADLAADRAALDTEREFFLGAFDADQLVGFGGVTPDPYIDDATVGRLRHLFVPAWARRSGIGRSLVRALEDRATPIYQRLRLRTNNPAAARFYEHLGYDRSLESNSTHSRPLY